ncbi:hypothetical protein KI387_026880 [Taxus chinensis]|uniref:Eukaryotic translation initiation factor 3 subunit G N-terminal domain-containing protein n=1 Tax=Taxus chinensis TaxID=29808 RepID=A0AA38FXG0_TAXCH|nr:hypothetical protein KI387_026880 [Taxus chinensis]
MVSDRVRWGELKEKDNKDLNFLLQLMNIIGLNENNMKKIMEYKFNEQGQKVVHTTTIHILKVDKAFLNKNDLNHYEWWNFGIASNQEPLANFTDISLGEILLEHPYSLGSKADDSKYGGDMMSSLASSKGGVVLMFFHICGSTTGDSKSNGDALSGISYSKGSAVLIVFHIHSEKGNNSTIKFPYKDIPFAHAIDTLPRDKAVKGHTSGGSITSGVGTTYVIRHLPMSRAVWTTLTTTCAIEMLKMLFKLLVYLRIMRDVNLHELFKSFGHITCFYMAMDQKMD